MKIFGRNPAFFVAVLQALVTLLVTFQLDWLTPGQAALWSAVFIAVGTAITMWTVTDKQLALLVGVAQAIIALAVGYGFQVSAETVAAFVGLFSVVAGGFLRTQVAPAPENPLTVNTLSSVAYSKELGLPLR